MLAPELVIAAAWLSLNYAEPPNHGKTAAAALYSVWVCGLFITACWLSRWGGKRAWDTKPVPST